MGWAWLRAVRAGDHRNNRGDDWSVCGYPHVARLDEDQGVESMTDCVITKPCECGCGKPTSLAPQTNKKDGWIKGQPLRFIRFHHNRRERHPQWKGGVTGHRKVAERAIGRPLPLSAVVHHRNEIRSDNRPCNLVICENNSYHLLLHARARAYAATGSVLGAQCTFCKKWHLQTDADIKTRFRNGRRWFSYHPSCWAARERTLYHANKQLNIL